jgi:hypothetical protein
MAKSYPKTKQGKKNKVGVVMGEFKDKKLKSGSGRKVTSPKQAIAIALNESGLSKKKRSKRSKG